MFYVIIGYKDSYAKLRKLKATTLGDAQREVVALYGDFKSNGHNWPLTVHEDFRNVKILQVIGEAEFAPIEWVDPNPPKSRRPIMDTEDFDKLYRELGGEG